MRSDPACLYIDISTPDGKATGLVRDSVVSCLVLVTVYSDAIAQVLGSLSPSLTRRLDDCLKTALALP
jgi:mRNA interferase MazF